jgi:hypothetical protein
MDGMTSGTRRRRLGRMAGGAMAVAATALMQGCAAPPPPVAASTTRVYAVDQQGAAKKCKTSPVAVQAAKEVSADMTVGNDGGWCALSLHMPDGRPYAAGLLTRRPAHGTVYIHTVGDDTRIDYTPEHGYAGPDTFAAALIPGEGAIGFSVTVTQP